MTEINFQVEDSIIIAQKKLEEVEHIIARIKDLLNDSKTIPIINYKKNSTVPFKPVTANYTTVLSETRSSKVGDVAVTYAPLQTCDNSCPFKDKGCYAQNGHCGFTFSRLTKNASKATLKAIALEEARKITELTCVKPLRLHISGDCRTPETAKILAEAARIYTLGTNQPVWTYTHSWRLIPRENWGNISVLASCETFEDVAYANSRGYAACMVRYKPFEKPFYSISKDITYQMVPCKEQVKGIKCSECKMCFNDKKLLENESIICFFTHGSQKRKVEEILKRR